MLVKVENNCVVKYPYPDIMMMYDNPNVSFPVTITKEIRESFCVYEVESTVPPLIDSRTQRVVELNPVQHNGVWEQAWEIVQLTEEEQRVLHDTKTTEVRQERNRLLMESDFSQLGDVELSNREEWITYRRLLRNITAQGSFPYSVIWPKKPEIK